MTNNQEELERIIREFIPHRDSEYIPALVQAIIDAGYIRKQDIKLDVLKIKDILNFQCQQCNCGIQGCNYTCSILAHTVAQAKDEIIKVKGENET